MKPTQATDPDEMRMPASDFDRMMRSALGVAPPPVAPKAKPKKRTTAAKKKATKA